MRMKITGSDAPRPLPPDDDPVAAFSTETSGELPPPLFARADRARVV
jgi:hypothetical protein